MADQDRYRQAGVDIEKGNEFVKRIGPLVKSTHNSSVLTGLGGFSGLVSLGSKNYDHPVLVSSTDGVGTKLKIAFLMDKHDTVGIDMVAMCINDVAVTGAKPLFMLDYLSTGRLSIDTLEQVVSGIVEGCRQARCALVGGETAEMPGFYPDGEYDMAGFAVGVVDKSAIIDGSSVAVGSALVGIGSSGLHSNGYSLVRKVIFEEKGLSVNDRLQDLDRTVGEELIEPTIIYSEAVLNILRDFDLYGAAHITGGGILENLPRVLPASCRAVINKDAWPVQPIFRYLQKEGGLTETEMYRTFNSGLGMILVVPPEQADDVKDRLTAMNLEAYLVGEVLSRKEGQASVEMI